MAGPNPSTQERESSTLFEHAIDAGNQITGDGKIDRVGHPRVDDKLNAVVGLDRDVSGPDADG
jgi:hypothetical protein